MLGSAKPCGSGGAGSGGVGRCQTAVARRQQRGGSGSCSRGTRTNQPILLPQQEPSSGRCCCCCCRSRCCYLLKLRWLQPGVAAGGGRLASAPTVPAALGSPQMARWWAAAAASRPCVAERRAGRCSPPTLVACLARGPAVTGDQSAKPVLITTPRNGETLGSAVLHSMAQLQGASAADVARSTHTARLASFTHARLATERALPAQSRPAHACRS